MSDIFGAKQVTYGNSFSGDAAQLRFNRHAGAGNDDALPALVQGLNFSYQQEVTRLYELSESNKIYFVRGRSQGAGQMQQILGPAATQFEFLRRYGSVCKVDQHNLSFEMNTGCTETDLAQLGQSPNTRTDRPHGFALHFVVLTAVAIQMQVQNMLIQQSVSLQFGMMTELQAAAAGP